jgi:dipeptidyl aminopeptidase/acylaminoacyl peptidase
MANLGVTIRGLLVALVLASAGCAHGPQPDSEVRTVSATSAPQRAAYGSWTSPLAAARLAESAISLSDLRVHDGLVYWRESRPAEGGRLVLMRREADGSTRQLTPAGFNVRTRVHEYGGASYALLGDTIVFSHFADQRLYLQRGDTAPVPLTPPGYQWADCVVDTARRRLICVREDHTPATRAANGEERNEIVALAIPDGAPTGTDAGTVLVTGTDFIAYPRPSADGRQLAWISWNHPDMPWDRAALSVASIDGERLAAPRRIVDRERRAALEPLWAADGTLYYLDDPDGWWNLQRWREGTSAAVAPMQRELGGALWQLGASTYVLLDDRRALVRSSFAGNDRLALVELASGAHTLLDLPFQSFTDLRRLDSRSVVAIAASGTQDAALITIDVERGTHAVLHRPNPPALESGYVARGEAIEFPTAPGPDGAPRTAHAFFYAPTNPDFVGPADRKPPLIVTIHGGPTSVSKPTLSLGRQFFTTRGFALVDVNYGGSTSFGRAYRERLNGQWGVVDVADAIAAVDHLVAQGRVDPERVAIRGGSAGGFTTLAALAFTDRFKAGANWFGVSDIKALAATSHKFERLYDVSLVGPPDDELYRARSPIHHLDRFTEPLITLQGAEDKVVPPSQSRLIVEALTARGVPNAYIEFAGEQHGFRRAENIIRAHEAELYFYGRIFGFTPADPIEPVPIANLPAP